MQILVQHFQCWCYSYPTSTCLTAKATSVLTHLIKRGEINTVAETDSRLMLFKELKKSILKNSMKINRGISTYVGKSIIENKEKYRIPYGSPASPPEEDFDISDMVWKEKGRKKKD